MGASSGRRWRATWPAHPLLCGHSSTAPGPLLSQHAPVVHSSHKQQACQQPSQRVAALLVLCTCWFSAHRAVGRSLLCCGLQQPKAAGHSPFKASPQSTTHGVKLMHKHGTLCFSSAAILTASSSRSGLWSSVTWMALPPLLSTARESPAVQRHHSHLSWQHTATAQLARLQAYTSC